jgi:alanyl-tRNA synthetase
MPDRPQTPVQTHTSAEIRAAFLDFYREKDHTIVPSAPLVPQDDPTLLFINAGMNPFKDVFLGTGSRPYVRVANTQKCLRVSGKHNDLEEVGHDTYHHTLFEMLGNWSFGDYFKKEAIAWAWDLLVDRFALEPDRLYATVHEGDPVLGLEPDDEAAGFWRSETSIPHDHILYGSSKDNFWMMGDTGPCGPCSELHIDLRTDEERAATPGSEVVNTGDPRVIEIWNLVFIQYNAQRDGSLEPLAAKHVDTGMGFERLCAVLQGTSSTYDTDLFAPIFDRLRQLRDADAPAYADADERAQVAMRVVADHIRAISFAVADGATPGNAGRGYVIRRILRRAVRYGYQGLGFREPFLWRLVEPLVATMGSAFPELGERRAVIERTIRAEEEGFLRTLGTGIEMFEVVATSARAIKECDGEARLAAAGRVGADAALMDLLQKAYVDHQGRDAIVDAFTDAAAGGHLPGEVAFLLHDTYGFPGDLTALMAREEGLSVDEARFSELMEQQRQRARAAGAFAVDQSDVAAWQIVSEGEESVFEGYGCLEIDGAHIRRIRTRGQGEDARHEIVLDRTPFYAESGGQIGDVGVLVVGGEELRVEDTQRLDDGTITHEVDRLPSDPSASVLARIEGERRRRIIQHHSATHLLHAALRRILGDHVQQKGSLVAPDRLRFDFSHFEKVSPEEQRLIERRVNEWIQRNIPAQIDTNVPIAEAKERGAMALFGEKYGETVRVVTFDPEVSVELCGGTHVGATGEIGLLRILSEGSVASGIRRIEAVAGEAALEFVDRELAALDAVRGHFRTLQKPVEEAVADLVDERRQLEKEVAGLKQQAAAVDLDRLLEAPTQIDGVRLVTGDLGTADMDTLRDVATRFRDRLGEGGVAVLGARDPEGGKVYLAAAVADDVITRGVQAGKLVGALAKRVGGGGGGRPQVATAGGRNPEALPEALAAAEAEVRAALGG